MSRIFVSILFWKKICKPKYDKAYVFLEEGFISIISKKSGYFLQAAY